MVGLIFSRLPLLWTFNISCIKAFVLFSNIEIFFPYFFPRSLIITAFPRCVSWFQTSKVFVWNNKSKLDSIWRTKDSLVIGTNNPKRNEGLFKNSKVVFPWSRWSCQAVDRHLLLLLLFFFFFNKFRWILRLNIMLHFKAIAWDSQPCSHPSQAVFVYTSVGAHFRG